MLSAIFDQALGVIAGFVSLFLSHAILAPRLSISHDIRVRWADSLGRYTYAIRLQKAGFIDLIDVRCQGRLHVQDVGGIGVKTWDIYRINMSFTDRIIFPRDALRIHFKLHDFWKVVPARHPHLYAIPEHGIRMEDIFMSHRNVYFSVQFIGSDRFTGVTKAFVSPKYGLRDLRFGDWDGMIVKEAVQQPALCCGAPLLP